jgi:hypothetical protein
MAAALFWADKIGDDSEFIFLGARYPLGRTFAFWFMALVVRFFRSKMKKAN